MIYNPPNLDWIFYIFITVFILIIGLCIYCGYQESQTIYEMPNGVLCESKLMRGGGAFSSGSTFIFRECEDGEKYINPEHYGELRK